MRKPFDFSQLGGSQWKSMKATRIN
jgi:hypothetical protein